MASFFSANKQNTNQSTCTRPLKPLFVLKYPDTLASHIMEVNFRVSLLLGLKIEDKAQFM